MSTTKAEELAALLVVHGRADELNDIVDDRKRPLNERNAVEGFQNVALKAAAELRRLDHNNRVLTDALWKACGDDEETVNATIESQGELN